MKIFSLTFLVFIICSCNQDKNNKSIKERVHSTDTICKREILEAENDIAKNKLVYCNYVGNIVRQPLRAEREMDSLLKRNHIEYKNESSGCLIQPNRNYHCYCELMQEAIDMRFGHKFADSLLYLADSLWVVKNLDKVFDNKGFGRNWDKPTLYPNDTTYDQTNHSGLQKAFDKIIVYPKDYREKKGENSMAMLKVYLTVDEKGNGKVTDFQPIFWDSRTNEEDYNKKHWKYFESITKHLIENTLWTPAKIKNVNVKSENDIFIYLK